ncbi:MAG: hypothetical protein JO056_11830 [Alphaproteobacteria bacterium]|nr:hypothetical protein [Alphaproteobacteria bacterium]
MSRMSIAIGALALTLSMPAFAQTATTPPAGGAMTGPSSTSSSMSSMTCDQMMAKEESMAGNASGARLTAMQNHMSMARQAKAKGDEAGCKTHVQMAMDAMK